MAREYKDSGIEWIGMIPKEWKVCRLKGMAHSLSKGNGITKEEVFPDGDTPCVRYGEIYSKYNGAFVECVSRTRKDNLLTTRYFDYGDILFAGTGELVEEIGKNIVYMGETPCLAGGDIIILKHSQNPVFLNYALNSQYAQCQKSCGKAKLKVVHISSSEIGDMQVILPPLSEQHKIVDYLDKVCGEVDEMIALQEKMIEELKAYKQSIITEAVTKGLNPNVPMKNSGIDWIGEIPEHWNQAKTLYILSMPITDGPHTTPDLYDEGIPFISADAVSDGYINFDNKRGYISKSFYEECCKKYIPQRDDIYMIKSGASTGRTAIVDTDEVFTIWSPLAVFRANKNIMNSRFLLYVLRSEGYQKQVENNWSYGTQQNIGMRTLERLIICYPSLPEQRQIASFLDTKCSEIDSLIAIKQQKIAELKEYKKSIIYEYVTGKKEVV